MALYNANSMIRETRKAKGLTQEQLAEGICTRETIVKLENGSRKPNRFVLKELMVRLGLNLETYPDEFTSVKDMQIVETYNKCHELLRLQKFEAVKIILDEIEAQKNSPGGKGWQSGIGHYYFLVLKSGLYSTNTLEPGGNKYFNPKLGIEFSVEAIKLSRPDFEIEKIPAYFLASHEFMKLNTIAIAYEAMGEKSKALDIMRNLKANAERNYSVEAPGIPNKWYNILLSNMTSFLQRNGQYEECIKAAEEGMEMVMKHDKNITHYQNYMFNKAICLKKLGHIQEGKELYKKALLIVYALDGVLTFDFTEDKAIGEELFGEPLDLSVS